ncbi:zinc-binding domain-containing protein [Ustulina deusta]|nr:zinc-binding domain-containing protein [Ustulina deusta]KAI3335138.1 zinc-binding domain-containing protein [Ustulina deusta]
MLTTITRIIRGLFPQPSRIPTIIMTKRRNKPPETSSMHSSKHPEVSRLLGEDNLHFKFHPIDEESGCTKVRDTAVMGRFICHNPKCSTNGWSSKQIAITIRMYPRREYNARVYHQRCKSCGSLSKPMLDDTYAERVAYWLKKWCGLHLEKPPHSATSKGPHKKRFCEGCKAGHCSQLERE